MAPRRGGRTVRESRGRRACVRREAADAEPGLRISVRDSREVNMLRERQSSGAGALFADRARAGAALAARLDEFRNKDALVLGIARGGMVVAAVVARRLNAELDV